jgi:hypothetical protein
MTTLPLTPMVLTLTILALVLAYCAGATTSGIIAAAALIAAGVFIAMALFMTAAEAFAEGYGESVDDGREGGK